LFRASSTVFPWLAMSIAIEDPSYPKLD